MPHRIAVVLRRQRQRKGKSTAAPRFTLYGERTAQPLHQPGRDGQPEPGAAIFAGGRGVCLAERFKYQLLLLRWNTDAGVAHLKAQPVVRGIVRHGQFNLALMGKFQRVADEVAQAYSVSEKGSGDIRGDVNQQLQRFFAGGRHQRPRHGVQKRADLKLLFIQLNFSRLYFGVVENIVNDTQQGVG